jgi:hypothetical protein
VHEDGGVEDPIGVEVEVLDVVVPEHSLEEVAGRQQSPRSMNRVNMRISSGFFSIGYGSPVAVP